MVGDLESTAISAYNLVEVEGEAWAWQQDPPSSNFEKGIICNVGQYLKEYHGAWSILEDQMQLSDTTILDNHTGIVQLGPKLNS